MFVAVYTLLLVNHILLVYTFHTPVINTQTLDELRLFLENTRNVDPEYFKITSAQNPKANPEENSGYFQGDIILTQDQINNIINHQLNRNALTNSDMLWPNQTVIYQLCDDFDEEQRDAIIDAIQDIMKNTCIRFKKRRLFDDNHFIRVTGDNGGCYSQVGFTFNDTEMFSNQVLNLAMNTPGKGCFRHATIVHEFLHALGLYHMQSTYDRDDYVTVVGENIKKGMEHNFLKYTSDDVTNLNVPYDYESVMHYGPYAFSSNGEKTIIPVSHKDVAMGQREMVKASDWLRVNRLYNCNVAWDETPKVCDTPEDCENSQ